MESASSKLTTNSTRTSRSKSEQSQIEAGREQISAERPKNSVVEKAIQKMKAEKLKGVSILLCDTRLAEEDVAILAKSIKTFASIRSLSLFDTHLSVTGAKALGEALSSQEHLTMLDLGHNELGSEGVEAFCNALIRNSSLRTLGLANTGMGNAGATALAHVMRINYTLTEIYLNSNHIGDEGAKELAGALVFNDRSRLSKLFFYGNDITEAGVGEFQKLLQDCPEVEERVPLSAEMSLALALGTHLRVGSESPLLLLGGEQACPTKGEKKARRQVHPLLRIVRDCGSFRSVRRLFYGVDKDKK